VRTWVRQLAASKSRDLPELDRLAERLAADVPVNPQHAIVHGDYRLDNVVVADDLSIAAVLDWEMSTLGDPLTDVASMAVWWDGLRDLDSPVAAVPGEYLDVDSTYLVKRYAELVGAEPERMSWYLGFAYFKLAAIFEGIYYRFAQGQTVGEGFDRIGALVGPMTDAGHRELDEEIH
jgi:aminoglycoside phosphotransferase (APT) family kinase protein